MVTTKVVRIDRPTSQSSTRTQKKPPKTRPVPIDSGNHRARVLARRDELVEQHLSLVDGIARQIARSLPSAFDLDDLVATGNLALVRAATRYRPGAHGGAPFSAFARQIIRGAILNSVARKNWNEGTQPGLDGLEVLPSHIPGHVEAIDSRRLARRLREAMSWLEPEERKVIQTYYGADAPALREVAERLGQPYTKTWQIHAAAVEALRRRFRISGVRAA